MLFARELVGDSLAVKLSALTRASLVRIQVPQPSHSNGRTKRPSVSVSEGKAFFFEKRTKKLLFDKGLGSMLLGAAPGACCYRGALKASQSSPGPRRIDNIRAWTVSELRACLLMIS